MKLCNIGRDVACARREGRSSGNSRHPPSVQSTHLPHLGWMDIQAVILPSLNPRVIYNMDPPDATKWTA